MIKNIFGEIEDIKISDGDLKLNLENGIKLNSNFNTVLDLDENKLNKYLQFLNKNIFAKILKPSVEILIIFYLSIWIKLIK